jgi:hypothetical protein
MRIFNSILLILALQMWMGCSKDKGSGELIHSTAFDSAPAPIQESWQAARDADQHHDFLGAVTNLIALSTNTTLNPEQSSAVENSLDLIGAEAVAAAEKGNPEAVKAAQLLARRRR